jgi:hypothetical protein
MTPDEQIAKMTKAINQAIKILGDRFGSTEGDTNKTIQALKESIMKDVQPPAAPKIPPAATAPAAS